MFCYLLKTFLVIFCLKWVKWTVLIVFCLPVKMPCLTKFTFSSQGHNCNQLIMNCPTNKYLEQINWSLWFLSCRWTCRKGGCWISSLKWMWSGLPRYLQVVSKSLEDLPYWLGGLVWLKTANNERLGYFKLIKMISKCIFCSHVIRSQLNCKILLSVIY